MCSAASHDGAFSIADVGYTGLLELAAAAQVWEGKGDGWSFQPPAANSPSVAERAGRKEEQGGRYM